MKVCKRLEMIGLMVVVLMASFIFVELVLVIGELSYFKE